MRYAKPRIVRIGDYWHCHKADAFGVGVTPVSAFLAYQFWRLQWRAGERLRMRIQTDIGKAGKPASASHIYLSTINGKAVSRYALLWNADMVRTITGSAQEELRRLLRDAL